MNKFNVSLFYTILSVALGSLIILVSGLVQSGQATQFEPPGDAVPQSSMGAGSRGSVQFSAPGDATPGSSMGAGSRGDVTFSAPGDATPGSSMGAGSRGDVTFSAPGDATPGSSMGAGSRGEATFSAPGDATPGSSMGAGSRGDVTFSAPGDATPGHSVGSGSRNDQLPALTALLPTTQYGRTVSARPTFFVYVPPTSSKEVFFSLQDEQGNHHYQTMLKISGGGGVVSVTLPNDAPELEIGKNYMWFFAPIAPGGTLMPDNYGVTGWVKRVESSLVGTQKSTLPPKERATTYAKAGVWYDTLKVLASAQQQQPKDTALVKEWQELLEQVGLNAIATQPITQQL